MFIIIDILRIRAGLFIFILVLTHLICCAYCYSYVSTLDLASHAEDSCTASRAAVDARAAAPHPDVAGRTQELK